MEQLGFISFVPWTLIFTIVNAFILYRLVKRFLFKPVQKILSERQREVDELYQGAEELQKTANDKNIQYEQQLLQAHQEADAILNSAKREALQEQQLLQQEATQQASQIVAQAKEEAIRLEQTALAECQEAIIDMAVDMTSKMTQQELDENTHHRLIKNAITQLEGIK